MEFSDFLSRFRQTLGEEIVPESPNGITPLFSIEKWNERSYIISFPKRDSLLFYLQLLSFSYRNFRAVHSWSQEEKVMVLFQNY